MRKFINFLTSLITCSSHVLFYPHQGKPLLTFKNALVTPSPLFTHHEQFLFDLLMLRNNALESSTLQWFLY